MSKTVIVILGPTGIGKTRTSIKIATAMETEIISADSRQFYREMNIGTATPSNDELSNVKHHFIHHLSIHDSYNASRFEEDALTLITALFLKYDAVVVTGGSMLYIDALCKGIDTVPDIDPDVRELMKNRFRNEGIEGLRLELKKSDPKYYLTADLKNPKRIIHALEVCLTTGKPFSSFRKNEIKPRPFRILKIGLNCEREILFDKINNRVDSMIADGLIDEAQKLLPYRNLNPLNTVGYRELFSFFEGKTDLEEAVRLIKRNTRRYAKKQLTWFARDPEINWFYFAETDKILGFIKSKINE